MSPRKSEEESAVRHPRETTDLFGHREAEMALLDAYRQKAQALTRAGTSEVRA